MLNHFRFAFYHNILRQRKCLFQSVIKIVKKRKSFQNERSLLAITLRDKLTRAALRLDSYRQRQISQSDCKITGSCGKKSFFTVSFDLAAISQSLNLAKTSSHSFFN